MSSASSYDDRKDAYKHLDLAFERLSKEIDKEDDISINSDDFVEKD